MSEGGGGEGGGDWGVIGGRGRCVGGWRGGAVGAEGSVGGGGVGTWGVRVYGKVWSQ